MLGARMISQRRVMELREDDCATGKVCDARAWRFLTTRELVFPA